jgi:hypothetical protein
MSRREARAVEEREEADVRAAEGGKWEVEDGW